MTIISAKTISQYIIGAQELMWGLSVCYRTNRPTYKNNNTEVVCCIAPKTYILFFKPSPRQMDNWPLQTILVHGSCVLDVPNTFQTGRQERVSVTAVAAAAFLHIDKRLEMYRDINLLCRCLQMFR